jgi:hypothetical protein
MDKIQQLILDTYTEKPRHYTQILKRNIEVLEYVKIHASHLSVFLEQLYFVVYRTSNICSNGNIMPLKTFAGYSFCGKTGVCKCAKESVSKSVSKSKQTYTDEEKLAINEKRKLTTQKIYGVSNNGQTLAALLAHKLLYTDKDKVSVIAQQIKDTKLKNHGDDTYNNRTKAESTCLEKYGFKNTWSLSEEKQNPNLELLRDKDKLSELFPKLSVQDIADACKLHVQTVYYYLNKHGFREPYKSTFEQEIIYYLNTLGITNILSNKRTIIGTELDIFLPDYNLAIEYNGIYWHHDKIAHISKTYHRDKFIECEKKGIELFTIFSDSWESKKDVWKLKIKSKLKLVTQPVYARKTTIVELTSAETRTILDNNHVQGYSTAQYCYGLKYNNELVAVMTFSNKRAGIGKDRGPDHYELVRYVTSTTVVGGASKLLNYFVKKYLPISIYSYSDNQYSVGNLYKVLGFSLEKDNLAGYKYYSPQDRKMYHRFNFAKHNLIKCGFDPLKTEKEIMDDRGYLRIWDCGSRTWVLNIKSKIPQVPDSLSVS